jgi:hypothetical protein
MASIISALAPLVAAIVGAILAWLDRRRGQVTLEDAQTPHSIRDAWDRWLRDRLRHDSDGRD